LPDDLHYRRLLVALDGSPSSELALSAAISIAEREHGSLTLIGVSPDIERAPWVAEAASPRQLQKEADAQVEGILAEASARVPDELDVQTILRRGKAGPAIVEYAADGSYDAILLGARGLGRVAAALGSVSQYVLHHSDAVVLVTHRRTPQEPAP
jgi:nucleotide-binding universal stress UspA family protein